ncbi:hypothetical protein GCM10027570_39330 [Streptomonospora sediminis]
MTAAASAIAETRPQSAVATPADERGETVIGADIVAKIAARAATEVAGVVGADRAGRRAGSGSGRPRARARLTGNGSSATLRLRIAVGYPRPARDMARRVRAHTAHRVQYMTGMSVRRIDIEIAELVRGSRAE